MRFLHTPKVATLPALVVAGVVVVAGVAGFAVLGSDGEGPNGSGFTYRGDFYGLSGAEVRTERLGPVLERDVPIMDTTADVREVVGVDPEIAVATHLTDVGGTSAQGDGAWRLMSPDAEVTADPWAHPDVMDAVNPR